MTSSLSDTALAGRTVELAPVRVNAVAPGTVDGALWAGRPDDVRRQAFDHIAATSVIERPVTEPEVAAAVVHLLLATGTTGSVLYPDGGYSLR